MWPAKFQNLSESFVNLVCTFTNVIFFTSLLIFILLQLSRLVILPKRVVTTIAKPQCYAHTDPNFKNLGILKF